MKALAIGSLALLSLFQQQPEDGRGQALFDGAWHAARRQDLLDRVSDGVIVLRGAPTQNDYREFRQDNNFWYFTGVTTPNAALVLLPEGRQEVLFLPRAHPMMERWLGDLVDPEEARAITGIEDCREESALQGFLEELAQQHATFYVQAQPAENWMMSRDNLQGAAAALRKDPFDGRLTREQQFSARLKESLGVEVKDITVTLDAMRVKKTPQELEAMRRACAVSGQAHERAMREAQSGQYEWQIAALMTAEMLRLGGRGPAYMAIVGSGPNATVLHYSANNRRIADGELVLIDYGAELNHYVADVTRTWPVSGRFSPRQREVYEAVLAAQEAAFAECRPGSNLGRVHRAAEQELARRGLGQALWHGTSHWLGMAVHDVGAPFARFEPGMVFTVEPGAYLPDEGFGVRVEDVVAITEDGYELLTAGLPRRVEEIEALRRPVVGASGG